MSRILQVFNRYLHPGGEEKSVERIYRHASVRHELERCYFDSRDWQGPEAPNPLSQAAMLFYNPEAKKRFSDLRQRQNAELGLFHNIYPVGSPALYHAALRTGLPIIQYLHNFRPFSVSGTLYSSGKLMPEALHGNYWPEIKGGTWQGSRLKTALFAVLLKMLHSSRWLDSVTAWVAISEFMRQKMIKAGLPEQRVHTLLHSWDARPNAPAPSDQGYYLYLGRLVEEKGVETLLSAWREMAKGPNCPTLRIAGDGPLRAKVESMRLPQIQYVGQITGDEKEQSLTHCRALLAPSTWWEPLGLVTYEAYDYAKPVIAAAAGGLTETVVNGSTGWLHKPGHVGGLIEALQQMETLSADARLEMGTAGRRWLLSHTSIPQWQDRFDQIVRSALDRRPRG
jgi:glycosyltransferase involved in cell wall biosynthesis